MRGDGNVKLMEGKRRTRATPGRGKRGVRCKKLGTTRQKQAEILARRAKVADLYLAAWEQHRIAEELHVSSGTISKDLDAIHEAWLAESITAIGAYKARELRRIDRLEREAWDQWERSKQERESRTEERQATGPGDKRARISTTKTSQCGDPRYLSVVDNCVDRRCKILGLYAPAKVAQTDAEGNEPVMTEAERAMRLMAFYRLAKDREAAASAPGAIITTGGGDGTA